MATINDVRGALVPSPKLVSFPLTLTTSAQTFYTGNSYRRPTLANIHICNRDTGACSVDLWVNNGAADFYIAYNYQVAAKSYVTIQGSELPFIAMEDGWTVEGLAEHNSHVDVIVSILEAEGRRVT